MYTYLCTMIKELNNSEALKTYGISNYVYGAGLSTVGYHQPVGRAYVFNVKGFKVTKNVFYSKEISYKISGKNIKDSIYMDSLDMNKVECINESLRLKLLSEIMSSDLRQVKDIMSANKKGFLYLINHVQEEEKLSKDLAFASVVKDYYNHKFDYVNNTNAIIKVMIKYGYELTTKEEAEKLIR